MDEAEERRIWKRDAAELRRSEVYPALLRLRAALRVVEQRGEVPNAKQTYQ